MRGKILTDKATLVLNNERDKLKQTLTSAFVTLLVESPS